MRPRVPIVLGGDAHLAERKLFLKTVIRRELSALSQLPQKALPPLLFGEHHHSHAASAFYPSPFEEAAVLCMDGVGEWATTSVWVGKGNDTRATVGNPLPSLARITVFRVYPIRRLQSEFWRIQVDGPCPLWLASLCVADL